MARLAMLMACSQKRRLRRSLASAAFLFFIAFCVCCGQDLPQEQEPTASGSGPGSWLRKAEKNCDLIKGQKERDVALTRLLDVFLVMGNAEKSLIAINKISDPELRLDAHLSLAEYFNDAQEKTPCAEQLLQAVGYAETGESRVAVANAYLRLLGDIEKARTCLAPYLDDRRVLEDAAEAFVTYGFVDAALKIAEERKTDFERKNLQIKIGLYAARKGDESATETVLKLLKEGGIEDRRVQTIYCELAEALGKNGRLEIAKRYADKVTEPYLIRTNRSVRRIKEGIPLDAPVRRLRQPRKHMAMFNFISEVEDPAEADRRIEATIAAAKRNPIDDSNGQFGPWNQQGELARIRLQYIQVAAVFRAKGQLIKADERMRIGEDAIRSVTKENSFFAMLAVQELMVAQIMSNDIEGLKRVAAVAEPTLWFHFANQVVEAVLESGDLPGATKIAWRVLAWEKPRLVGETNKFCDKIVSSLIHAGAAEVAYEILNANRNGEHIASALESAGSAMVETGNATELLNAKWNKGLEPEQRVYLQIGAAMALVAEANSPTLPD